MYCTKCGAECTGSEKFCGKCGNVITSPAANKPVENSTPVTKMPEAKKTKTKGPIIGIVIGAVAVFAIIILSVAIIATALIVKKGGADELISNIGKEKTQEASDNQGEDQEKTTGSSIVGASALERFKFLSSDTKTLVPSVTASVPAYTVNSDLSNIANINRYSYLDATEKQLLSQNYFYVNGDGGSNEFFSLYESNRYWQISNFVTVDSLMNSYHLYFSYLLKNTEKKYLASSLSELSKEMLAQSESQYNSLVGTEWEQAAKNNLAFFAVGAYLQDSSVAIPSAVQSEAETEISRVLTAEGMEASVISGVIEDYTQYIPRGYYEGDAQLEAYFRTMMWYGRMAFTQKEDVNDRSAVLMTLALRDSGVSKWETIYSVTSFFAGASDDESYYEYLPLIDSVYGENAGISDLIGADDKWDTLHGLTAQLTPPAINTIAGGTDDDGNIALSYRFMGQRFSVDAAIMQRLIANEVPERDLPDVLDVAAALGSEEAYSILESQGDTAMTNYAKNMDELKTTCENAPESTWDASLYAGWLNTLRPLLDEKGEGYPSYMQTKAWTRKNLETFAGSYAELKHDTVLYSKQAIAEGDGEDPTKYDDRGYVDPQSEVYARFANLSRKTSAGLSQLGMISAEDAEDLEALAVVAETLFTISEKELSNTALTEAEYDYIRDYGKTLAHFWYNAMRGITGDENVSSDDYPSALVVDVASSASGQCLEMGTGRAQTIYVVVPVEGKLMIASGTVYSFYQFPWSSADRLTDSKWRQMCGAELDASGWYNKDPSLKQPDWTETYRYHYSN